ncbi:transposase [Streptomyces sp. NBC_00076]|uniref:transposase n=1 Tax=Streptomyces sp. NBC_00076 TaxID=2975642 RepID=UPI0038667D93
MGFSEVLGRALGHCGTASRGDLTKLRTAVRTRVRLQRLLRVDHGGVVRRHELTDQEWELLAPLIPRASTGRPRVEDRRVINGMVYKIRTGICALLVPPSSHAWPPAPEAAPGRASRPAWTAAPAARSTAAPKYPAGTAAGATARCRSRPSTRPAGCREGCHRRDTYLCLWAGAGQARSS